MRRAGRAIVLGAGCLAAAQVASADPDTERARREEALTAIERELAGSAETGRRFADEIAAIRSDGATLAAALVDAAGRAQATETRIRAAEDRLADIAARDAALRASLAGRRDAIAAILGSLQQLGRHPPPALLARPDDILAALRAASLLGAVVPELRRDAERLGADLGELARLRAAAEADRAALAAEVDRLGREQTRLEALVDARRQRLAAREGEMAGGRARADALGRDARSLRDLVDRLEDGVALARRDTEERRRAAEVEAEAMRRRFAAAALRDPVPLAPRLAFADARGRLPRPASGPVLRQFGAEDGAGGTARGISIATRARAVVTAPADATVMYAGPFRSFGTLLILDAGGGYHLVVAGLARVSVDVGQVVQGGEPVGQMGEASPSSAASSPVEGASPVLYVEFRKDGGPVDPSPWWARSPGEKVRG